MSVCWICCVSSRNGGQRINDVGSNSFGFEEGCGAVCIEDSSEVEVAMAMGEIAEESNTIVKAKHGLGDIFVLAQKFGVNSNIAVILNWEWRCSWWLVELMFLPRVKRVGSLLCGNVWRWMTKVLCKPKRRSGCCCVMQRLWRALQMVVVCGLLVVRMMPSMLWMLGVLPGVKCTLVWWR